MKNYLLLSVLMFCLINLNGQTGLISSYPSETVLTSEQLLRFQKLSQLDKFSSLNLVQFNALSSSVNSNGKLQIDLIGDDCGIIEFTPKASRYIDNSNFYYYGKIEGIDTCQCICQEGEIMLEGKNGRKYGYIVIDETKYEILALGAEYNLIGKINKELFAGSQECAVGEDLPNNSELKTSEADISDRAGVCTIRVLFLFSETLENEFGLDGIRDMANLAISQTNQAMENSEVSNVKVELANLREWIGYTEILNDFEINLSLLERSGQSGVVREWRIADNADVVFLIANTEQGFENGNGLCCINGGVLNGNLSSPQFDRAFGIVESSSITSNYIFSHELAHIIGCRHQTCSTFTNPGCDNNENIYEHGSGWGTRKCWLCKWKNYSTLLHQDREGNTRLLLYSNPEVDYGGNPTGIVNERDNARWIREGHGCIVADYFPDPIVPLTAQIDGDPYICRPFTKQYFVFPTGTGPYTYEWHVSSNGINWGNVLSTSNHLDVNSANYSSNMLFLRVKVQNSLGISFLHFLVLRYYRILLPYAK